MRMSGWLRLLICAGALLGAACGIFSPREGVEEPIPGTYSSDRLGIKRILEGTGRHFVGQGYEDMFDDDFTYTYNRIYIRNRDDHIAYLEQASRQFPEIKIVWVDDTSDGKRDSYFGIDSGTIYREYYIWKTESAASSRLNDYSGTSRFDLRYLQEKLGWVVVRWYDESADGFFHHTPEH
jgi:hypothetical protein